MSVELEPPELGFKRPFTQEVSQVLRLRNPSSDPVAFKVKTTAPKQYCVRPNSGRIEGSGFVEVQVLLQAMKEDPPPDAKCRDKFLVQSVAISPSTDTSANVSQIWSNIEQTAKSSIQEKKIRVTFLAADGSESAATNGVSHHEDEPPAYSSPSPAAVTPQRSAQDTKEGGTMMGSTIMGGASGAAGGAGSSFASAVPTSQDELKQQLSEAQAQIAKLREQAAEGLRQRKPQEAAEKAMSSMPQSVQNASAQAPGGVSVQIVAVLCLLCFLIAYFFF
ncbi:phosphatidylinositol-binding protein scs2 [Saxophila tyrrhenica]|uniref:Phosphatidylinositol-binding protein scs2 n=1 Tax=Saxophila tyrrhenica TaxID=1690608 RepID=A0AAV9NVE6_9PEZI|nr:phosphatidylinositol-binding protein scs2 [Saxophila tyrrhenica]